MSKVKKRKIKELPKVQKADGHITNLRPGKYTTHVIGPVQRHLVTQQSLPNGRDNTVIHPSEVVQDNWCSRQDYYRITKTPETDEDKRRNHSPQLEMVFANGHHIHDKWQKWLWEMGDLQGVFECIACSAKQWMVSPKDCPNCGAWAFANYDHGPLAFMRYSEVPIRNDKYLIGGHADGMTVVGKRLIEIKSVGPGTVRVLGSGIYKKNLVDGVENFNGMWRDIKRPFSQHIKQAAIYAWMLKDTEHEVTEIVFIYEDKQSQRTKEFVVKVTDKHIEDVLDKCLDLVYQIENEKVPQRPSWATSVESSKCNECPWRSKCWEENSKKTRRTVSEKTGRKTSEEPRREKGDTKAKDNRSRSIRKAPRRRNPRATRRPNGNIARDSDGVF